MPHCLLLSADVLCFCQVFAGLNQLTGELMAVKVKPGACPHAGASLALSCLFFQHGTSPLQVLPLSTQNENAEQRSHLEALEHELGMYRKFQHRHIVGYIAAHMDFKTNTMYMFLEYVPGGSIASMLERFGAFRRGLGLIVLSLMLRPAPRSCQEYTSFPLTAFLSTARS